jgi:hypothetical protein
VGIFSHFSAALIFFVTFFYQEKKVKSIYAKKEDLVAIPSPNPNKRYLTASSNPPPQNK